MRAAKERVAEVRVAKKRKLVKETAMKRVADLCVAFEFMRRSA